MLLPRPFYKHLCMKMVASALYCHVLDLFMKTACKIEVLAIE